MVFYLMIGKFKFFDGFWRGKGGVEEYEVLEMGKWVR